MLLQIFSLIFLSSFSFFWHRLFYFTNIFFLGNFLHCFHTCFSLAWIERNAFFGKFLSHREHLQSLPTPVVYNLTGPRSLHHGWQMPPPCSQPHLRASACAVERGGAPEKPLLLSVTLIRGPSFHKQGRKRGLRWPAVPPVTATVLPKIRRHASCSDLFPVLKPSRALLPGAALPPSVWVASRRVIAALSCQLIS